MRPHLSWLLLPLTVACGPGADPGADPEADLEAASEPVLAVDEASGAGPENDLCVEHDLDNRSLILNDLPALAARNVTLRRILATLAAQTQDPADSADTLYASMVATGMRGVGGPTVLDDWYGVAFVNRFDLAPKEGETCGEYRLIVSRPRRIGPPPAFFVEQDQFTLIFEASVANPTPALGRGGCLPLQRAWARLSTLADPVARAAALEALYFTGGDGFPPIVHIDHYGARGRGQVRGNFFLNSSEGPWFLDEFAIVGVAPTSAGIDSDRRRWGVTFIDRPVADTLGVNIVKAGPPATREIAALRSAFISQLSDLAAADPSRIRYTVPEASRALITLAAVNPNPEGFVGPANFPGTFLANGGDQSHFGQQISAGMAARGITGITPTQMVRRAFTHSCGGCHDDARADIGGGATWPINPGARVFIIGPNGALSGPIVAFLPGRLANLQAFLACP